MESDRSLQLEGLALHHAAVIAGVGLLIVGIAAPFAQFFVFPSLVVSGSVEQTIQNLTDQPGFFLAGILAYFVNYTFDVVVAWALYVLLAPVNRSVSLLALAFCLVYIAMGLTATLNYVEVFRALRSPEVMGAIGAEQLDALLYLRFVSYQYDWGYSLLVFGVVLLLRGYLIVRSAYVPSVLGWLLAIAGLGYLLYELAVLTEPAIGFRWLAVTFAAEPAFMLWLIIRGWRIEH